MTVKGATTNAKAGTLPDLNYPLNLPAHLIPGKTSPINTKAPVSAVKQSAAMNVTGQTIPAISPPPTAMTAAQAKAKTPYSAAPLAPMGAGKAIANKPLPSAGQAAAALRPTPSSVAAGKRPLVTTKSAVPVVPSAPARSVTGTGYTNPPAPPAPIATATKRTAAAALPATQTSTPSASSQATHTSSTGAAALAAAGGITSFASAASNEREKIRDFWLGLSEIDRRGLVKIEKDAVLKKMKEQQRHGCTCAVCGRKRNAIEVELEVLYDAYYDELENYANHQQLYKTSAPGTIPPPLGPGPFPGSVDPERFVTPATAPAAAAPAAVTKPPAAAGAKKALPPAQTPPKGRPAVPPAPAAAVAAKATATTKEKHHTHSPSCPHYPHSHTHPHHHHHPAAAAAPGVQGRGKETLMPAAAAGLPVHAHDDDAVYSDEDEDYGDEEDDIEGEYDDDGKPIQSLRKAKRLTTLYFRL